MSSNNIVEVSSDDDFFNVVEISNVVVNSTSIQMSDNEELFNALEVPNVLFNQCLSRVVCAIKDSPSRRILIVIVIVVLLM